MGYQKCIVLGVLLFCGRLSSTAQRLTLYDAVAGTLEHYPAIKQGQMQVKAGKAHLQTVKDYSLPSLILHDQVDVGSANSMVGSYFPLGIIPSTSGAITNANRSTTATGNVAASVMQWDLYNFGYINAQKQEARAAVATSEARLNGTEYLLTEQVVALYIDFVRKYQLLKVQEQNINRAATLLGSIRAHVLSGLRPGVDSSVAHAEYASARISYLQTRAGYMGDKSKLAWYTGRDTADVQPDTTMLSKLDYASQLSGPDSVSEAQPILQTYQQEYEQQLAANRTYTKRNAPKISLLGAAWMRGSSINNTNVYSDAATGLAYSRYNYMFGAAATYNIMDLKQHRDRVVEGQYLADAKQAALQTAKESLENDLQQANIAFQAAMDKQKELPALLTSARQAYAQQQILFNAGLNTIVDVTNSLYALDKAETEQVIAQGELLQAWYTRAAMHNEIQTFLEHFK